jgi:hypothetical protein
VLRLGSPGSLRGLRTIGVGVGVTSTGGVGVTSTGGVRVKSTGGAGVGDKPGVCGKACSPGVGVGVRAALGAGVGARTGDAAGRTCPLTGHIIAPRQPSTVKTYFRGTNFLISILFLTVRISFGGSYLRARLWTGRELWAADRKTRSD